MAFAFNFTGNDIDNGEEDPMALPHSAKPNIEINSPPLDDARDPVHHVATKKHNVREMRRALIPRRALFDVRVQIMAESPQPTTSPRMSQNEDLSTHSTSSSSVSSALAVPVVKQKQKKRKTAKQRSRRDDTNGHAFPSASDSDPSHPSSFLLTESDLTSSVYEGGFKSWEGSLDLARLVLERGPRKDLDELSRVHHLVELGCGTALPSLVLFQHALRNHLSLPLTLADYNADVLRLVTLPNLLCVWALEVVPNAFAPRVPTDGGEQFVVDGDGDLEVDAALLDRFVQDLEARGMVLTLLSGPWAATLTKHLRSPLAVDMGILVLAAETIYSPVSMKAFAEVLQEVLKSVSHGKAFVAAKRVYFGVGGSVDAFKEEMSRRGALCVEVQK
ncbi:MAG: hypothetical protein Q9159_006549 [Coniocarpon cinnabarinum]